MTQAVIFDLDGTLTNTEAVWDEERRALMAREGLEWSEADSRATMGMSTPDWSGYTHRSVGFGDNPDDAARRTIDAMLQREPEEGEGETDIIILTHVCQESAADTAIAKIEGLAAQKGKVKRIRLEELQ